MNKVGIVLGVAVVATLAGCKDPNYRHKGEKAQDEVKQIESETVTIEPTSTPVIEVKPIETPAALTPPPVATEVKPVAPAPAAEEYTIYIVQRGDYLAKISKRYNVTINSIKKLNNLKDDKVLVGQKLKLPGKIEVGAPTVAVAAGAAAVKEAAAKSPTREYKPYTGATKEYVVKSGDTLGKVAYSNGVNIRQLKELNGLDSDVIKVGQKLKIPAEKVVAEVKPAVAKAATNPAPIAKEASAAAPKTAQPAPKAAVKAESAKAAEVKQVAQPVTEEPEVAAEAPAPATPAAGANPTHVVQEGEDVIGIAVRFNVSPAEIRELNGLADGDEVKAGQTIKLPEDAQQE